MTEVSTNSSSSELVPYQAQQIKYKKENTSQNESYHVDLHQVPDQKNIISVFSP